MPEGPREQGSGMRLTSDQGMNGRPAIRAACVALVSSALACALQPASEPAQPTSEQRELAVPDERELAVPGLPEGRAKHSDELLAEAVAERLAEQLETARPVAVERGFAIHGEAAQIGVTADAGVVTLEGRVSTPSELRRAIVTARAVPGVRSVDSQLALGVEKSRWRFQTDPTLDRFGDRLDDPLREE